MSVGQGCWALLGFEASSQAAKAKDPDLAVPGAGSDHRVVVGPTGVRHGIGEL